MLIFSGMLAVLSTILLVLMLISYYEAITDLKESVDIYDLILIVAVAFGFIMAWKLLVTALGR